MGPHQAGFLDLLRTQATNDSDARANAQSLFARIFYGALCGDVLCSLLFAFVNSNWSITGTWESLQRANLRHFSSQAWDCVLLTLARAIIFPSIVLCAVRWSKGSKQPLPAESGSLAKGNVLHEPLIWGNGEGGASSSCEHQRAHEDRDTQLAFAKRLRQTTVGAIFVLSTAFQLIVGLKVSAYTGFGGDGHSGYSAEVALLCVSVFWINLEVYALRSLIEELTREDGLFLPAVHPHPLFINKGVALHWCDVCSTRIKGHEAWRCKLCDFDMCPTCAARGDVATVAENILRGDKGRREEETLSNVAYLLRALGLAASDSGLLTGAFSLLFLFTATNLALPDYQGKIIDKIADVDKPGFLDAVRVYFIIMCLQGLFSAGYNAAFGVVSRRVLYAVRTQLFNNVLDQDVAFFDGTTSGHLTSRLTNDVNTMMEPIRSSFSTLLYNAITLVGTVTMCYFTSYELSMLAFVTIGPIMYLWELYGSWSKLLTRRMLAAFAEGNSIATEALGHVRTVKAFASEPLEKGLYNEASREALRLGIKDSLGFGLTSALTGYLDLGAGVLILWYGGKLVLNGDESGGGQVMTVGKLVTFQLYWNMMNNSYQSLQGLITSFTRSAAAAEKVFALIDSVRYHFTPGAHG